MRNLAKNVSGVLELAESKSIVSLAQSILGENAFLVRSLFFDKTPDANWKVAWHQDITIAVQTKKDGPGFGPWSIKDGVAHVQPPVSVLEKSSPFVCIWTIAIWGAVLFKFCEDHTTTKS